MTLITDEYRALNAQQHHEAQEWGLQSIRYWKTVKELCEQLGINKCLDYGCGKRALERALAPHNIRVTNYDPAFPEYATPPEPHALVVCTDVLEHIEPECLDAVLTDLHRCTKAIGFFVISSKASIKNLPDGTNPHRIIQEMPWWIERMKPWFKVHTEIFEGEKYFGLLVVPVRD